MVNGIEYKKTERRYGWKKDSYDARDLPFQTLGFRLSTASLPPAYSLVDKCPPVWNQLNLGACSAFAISAAFEFDLLKQSLPDFSPSQLFFYYVERVKQGTIKEDSGSSIRNGIKCLNLFGICPDSEWPYDISKFAVCPPFKCFRDARQSIALKYYSVNQTVNDIKTAIFNGYPVVFGFSVYDSFESQEVAETGIVNLPALTESCLGGHAVCIVAWDDATQRFIIRNSWGKEWGLPNCKGYFSMPYQYVINPSLASDFWVVENVK